MPFRRLRNRLWARLPGSTRGSKNRNAFSYYVILLSMLIALDTYADHFDLRVLPGGVAAIGLVMISFTYFYATTIGVVRLVSKNFEINALRLLRDLGLSTVFAILSFSLLYRAFGLCQADATPSDHIYFSAVVFSTLGFGDFTPAPLSRPFAAMQALFGNLHLGLLVGAFYLTVEINRRDASGDDNER